MKALFFCLFLSVSVNLIAQIPVIRSNASVVDKQTSRARPYAGSYDFIISYREENIFRDNSPDHFLLAVKDSKWEVLHIRKSQKGTRITLTTKKYPVLKDSADNLMALFSANNFWNLNGNDDSSVIGQMPEMSALQDNERCYQRFECIQGSNFRVVEYYSPDAFLKRAPELENTRMFSVCRDAFLLTLKSVIGNIQELKVRSRK